YGNMVILIGGLLSTMSALNATTFSATRVSFAMGRDRYLPDLFAQIHQRTRTPYLALAVTGALILFMLVALPLESVAATTSLMFLLLFLMVNFSSVFIRRRYGDKLAFGYLTPFFPAVPILAVAIQLVLANYMLHFSTEVLLSAGAWLGAGALIYAGYSRRRVREKVPAPVVLEERPVLERGYAAPPVVLPIARPYGAEALIRTAAAIARTLDRHVLLLHVVTVPEQLPISAGNQFVAGARDEMRDVLQAVRDEGVDAELLIRLAHRPSVAIVRTLEASNADFCVLGWRGTTRGGNRVLGSNLDQVLKDANCNFVVMQEFPEAVDRIIMPASNPEQAEVFFAVGYAIARGLGAQEIDVVTVFDPSDEEEFVEVRMTEMANALAAVAEVEMERWEEPVSVDGVRVTFQAPRSSDTLSHILEMSEDYDLMLVGTGPGGPWGRDVLGRFTWALSRHPACPVVAVKRRTGAMQFQ
ncbi:MAG: amino acid permease, partial [Gemmatimonadetes bacterium]|nr:amino acid permease [Gemmatimonadota bacterium]NIR79261.1 amino acid permease [Gemmatimonadota bacterium]NIT87924.1 amino acid permease [Gemmatimonadota bacterium]NIU31781.1 amino acid permease [Gemmatimonadota bacterium]NIU36391.1 amino acid permease [Gemmatimonadota bacterium]